jgi:bifunctional non-homologous end joining protein LigD
VKTAYIDGELCGVDEGGLPSFAHTQSTDGGREVRLVYYAFDLLHLDGWDVSNLRLMERKALLDRDQARPSVPAMRRATANSS